MSGRFTYSAATVTHDDVTTTRVGAQMRDGQLTLRWADGSFDQLGVLTANPIGRNEWSVQTVGGTYTIKREGNCGCR